MKSNIDPKETEPMEEAYKMLGGTPSATAVSDAAKGDKPLTDDEQRMKEAPEDPTQDEAEDKEEGEYKKTEGVECSDLEEAYAMLFEGLATIIRH